MPGEEALARASRISPRRGLGSSQSWELLGFVSLSWQPLGQERGGEKGGLVAGLGNKKSLQSTDGHSPRSGAAQCSPPESQRVALGNSRKQMGKGELRGDMETAVV